MPENRKLKVLTISDHCLAVSGVGTQMKIIIDALVKSEKFRIISLAGAIKHQDYSPTKFVDWGDDAILIPTDDFGSQEQIRSLIRIERPDLMVIFSDPRFYLHLFDMANEIRVSTPLIYNSIWDNRPSPLYNMPFYESMDTMVCISKVTHEVVQDVCSRIPENRRPYIVRQPHAVDPDVYRRLPESSIRKFRKDNLKASDDKFVIGWVSRNARRKNVASLIFWFKEFLDKVGEDKSILVLHTAVQDPNGFDLPAILRDLHLDKGQVMISPGVGTPEEMALLYNSCDCTMNVSDAEGFGLPILESLSCETPVIVNMTGGLQEQVTDGKDFFGIGIESKSKYIIGSLIVPYIYEDRMNGPDVIDAMMKMYNASHEERREMGRKGRAHVLKDYNYQELRDNWVKIMLDTHERCGSWETRKNYLPYHAIEI